MCYLLSKHAHIHIFISNLCDVVFLQLEITINSRKYMIVITEVTLNNCSNNSSYSNNADDESYVFKNYNRQRTIAICQLNLYKIIGKCWRLSCQCDINCDHHDPDPCS